MEKNSKEVKLDKGSLAISGEANADTCGYPVTGSQRKPAGARAREDKGSRQSKEKEDPSRKETEGVRTLLL